MTAQAALQIGSCCVATLAARGTTGSSIGTSPQHALHLLYLALPGDDRPAVCARETVAYEPVHSSGSMRLAQYTAYIAK